MRCQGVDLPELVPNAGAERVGPGIDRARDDWCAAGEAGLLGGRGRDSANLVARPKSRSLEPAARAVRWRWVRPVSARDDVTLELEHRKIDGEWPQLLNIVRLEIDSDRPTPHHGLGPLNFWQDFCPPQPTSADLTRSEA